MRILLLFAALLFSYSGSAQKEKTIFFGVNVGVKIANKNYAQRYAGWYPIAGSIGHLETLLLQQNNYNTIYTMLGDKDFQLAYDGYPLNMRYTPGLVTGVQVGYNIGPGLQANLDANFNKLKVKDVFTMEVFDPGNFTTEPTIAIGQLYAEESRFNGRFNFDFIAEGDKVNFIIGLSGLFIAWRMDEHIAMYNSYTMPLFSVHNPTNNISTRTSGQGWGAGVNLGLEYRFAENMVGQFMYMPYFSRLDYFNTKSQIETLGSSYVRPPFSLEHDITLRILWK